MPKPSSEDPKHAALSRRLETLESELHVLRRELGEGYESRVPLPAGDFRALQFLVEGDSYALPIDWVREITRYAELTHVTELPSSVGGIINIRGDVFPVVDARARLGYPVREPGLRTSIIFTDAADRRTGLVVDRVLDVVTIEQESLREPGGALASARCLAAISTVNEGVTQIIDLARLLSVHEWSLVDDAITEHQGTDVPGANPSKEV